MIAQLLSQSGVEVDLLGHRPVSLDTVASRLALDLSKVSSRVTPDLGEEAVAELSEEYDLFVNATYMSRVKPRSRRSAYLCFFPTPHDHDLPRLHRAAIRHLGPHVQQSALRAGFAYGSGWFPPEGGRRRQWAWSNGDGRLLFDPGPAHTLEFDVGRPGAPSPEQLRIELADGTMLAEVTADVGFSTVHLDVPASDASRQVHLRSPTFCPGATDSRQLGIALSRLRHVGSHVGLAERMGNRYPWLRRNPSDFSFVEHYDVILANSQYTRDWIGRLWETPAQILYPPIEVERMTPAPVREGVILSVGRFFAPGYGHSKRQLEMVQMFGTLVRSGQLEGWKMVVLGGCEHEQQPYLNKVRAAAAGLPVEIHPNAPRSLVESMMSTASIFWSATGWKEDTEKRPWTNEHFGMTTAEAMAGGCVPVVIDRAGQREIVRQGLDGFRWSSAEQLRIRTVQVATEAGLRERMSASSQERVRQFSEHAFAARWAELAAEYRLLT
jgi:glycosyltransferase involved in cell wall biosynthesis